MSKTLFQFGERIPGYSVAVFNERAVRAAAGIFFLRDSYVHERNATWKLSAHACVCCCIFD